MKLLLKGVGIPLAINLFLVMWMRSDGEDPSEAVWYFWLVPFLWGAGLVLYDLAERNVDRRTLGGMGDEPRRSLPPCGGEKLICYLLVGLGCMSLVVAFFGSGRTVSLPFLFGGVFLTWLGISRLKNHIGFGGGGAGP